MTTSDLTPSSREPIEARPAAAAPAAMAGGKDVDTRDPARFVVTRPTAPVPPRPSLAGKEGAPVLVKLPAPFTVRLSQVAWVLSLIAGAAAVVYLFVIRQAQLPDIADLVRQVDDTRADDTYTLAADIVYWSLFGVLVAIIALQITFQVSFANRRPNVRWWLFGTVVVQAGVYLLARELVAVGERGVPLNRLLQAQLALAGIGLLVSVLPPALKWSARRLDVRRGSGDPGSPGDL